MRRGVKSHVAAHGLALGSTLALSGLVGLSGVVAFPAWSDPPREVTDTAEVSPAVLIERMTQAVRSRNYEGTLVYLHDNRLETLSLDHRIADGQIEERLIALSGPIRAVARGKDRVNCVLSDGQPISVEQHNNGRFLDTDGIDPAALQPYYDVTYLGRARVAGRDTDVVGLIPKDDLRYGYRFHIDRDTALPLKSDLIDRHQEPLEQLLFTSITLHPDATPDATSAAVAALHSVRSAPATTSSSHWRFDPLPSGFKLVMQQRQPQADGTVVEHFLFTDRLSSYSIYIEPVSTNGLNGLASNGSVHAAGRQVQGHQIIAVGEVPPTTVQAAVANVHHDSALTQHEP